MSDTGTSQSQQNMKWGANHLERMAGWFDEMDKLSEKNLERLQTAIDESNRLAKASIETSTQLMSDFRKIYMDASRQALEAFSAPFRG